MQQTLQLLDYLATQCSTLLSRQRYGISSTQRRELLE
jgi:hypothetical protein